MTKQQCDENSPANVKSFISNMLDMSTKYFISKDHLVNADETLLHGTKDSAKLKRIEARYESGGSVDVPSGAIGSLTPFVSASGIVWLLVISLKLPQSSKKGQDVQLYIPVSNHEKRSENSPFSILVLASSSGLLTSSLWDIAIQKFIEVIQTCSSSPLKEILLLTDNLGIHRQPKSIQKALEKGCFQFYFPPNCLHFIQPLDNLLFANLKRSIYSISTAILQQHLFWNERVSNVQEIIIDSVMESFPTVFTKKNIMKAWDNVGVHPLQPERILSCCSKNLGKISKQNSLRKKYSVAFEAKRAFLSLHNDHITSLEN